MLTVDLERAFLDHIATLTTVRQDIPGEFFSPERSKEWIEPRFVAIDRSALSNTRARTMSEIDAAVFQVRCFVKSLEKGGRRLALSALVDVVRAKVDATLGADAVDVDDGAPSPVKIGELQFGAASEVREYGVTVQIDDVEVIGCDVATLTIPTQVTGDP